MTVALSITVLKWLGIPIIPLGVIGIYQILGGIASGSLLTGVDMAFGRDPDKLDRPWRIPARWSVAAAFSLLWVGFFCIRGLWF